MSKMAMDALNRGWSLGLATGVVRTAREGQDEVSEFEKPDRSNILVTGGMVVARDLAECFSRLAERARKTGGASGAHSSSAPRLVGNVE